MLAQTATMKWTAVSVRVPTAPRMNDVTAQSATTRLREAKTVSRAIVKVNDLSWMTGGPQGSGVDSSANIFDGACVLGGLWTFGLRIYYSRIEGKLSLLSVRVNDSSYI